MKYRWPVDFIIEFYQINNTIKLRVNTSSISISGPSSSSRWKMLQYVASNYNDGKCNSSNKALWLIN